MVDLMGYADAYADNATYPFTDADDEPMYTPAEMYAMLVSAYIAGGKRVSQLVGQLVGPSDG